MFLRGGVLFLFVIAGSGFWFGEVGEGECIHRDELFEGEDVIGEFFYSVEFDGEVFESDKVLLVRIKGLRNEDDSCRVPGYTGSFKRFSEPGVVFEYEGVFISEQEGQVCEALIDERVIIRLFVFDNYKGVS